MRLHEQERQARGHIDQWKRSRKSDIMDAYGKPSTRKIYAWKYCEGLRDTFNGRNLKVISKNVNIFTAGFEFTDPDTGVVKFMYITPSYDVIVDME